MKEKSSTFGLSSEKLARILNIGTDIPRSQRQKDQNQRKAELLRNWLSLNLSLKSVLIESLPRIITRACHKLEPLAQESFGNLLQKPETDITAIKKIKDISKSLVKSAKSDIEQEAAVAIYYAAIANALVFHDRRISKLSYHDMDDSFSELISKRWLSPEFVKIYKKAQKICRKKAKHTVHKS